MGLDIGYDVWDNKDGKLIKHNLSKEEEDNTWVCGRCEVTYAWEYGCSFGWDTRKDTRAVFNKEFDNYPLPTRDPDYSVTLKYIDFNDFKEHIMNVVEEEYKEHAESLLLAKKRISKLKEEIKEYQELQLRATTDLVFDKFQEKIDNCKEQIEYDEQYLDTEADDDYNYSHAKAVENMIKHIEQYLKDGFVVSTFFSY